MVTFSNNLLIKRESMNPNNKFEVKTSNFQDWFPSGPIKIEIEKKYADKKEILNHLIELTIEYIKEKGLKINKKEKKYILELFFYWIGATDFLLNELKKNNIPYIVVLTNPTTGGVSASWAMIGDILIAEPKATIGFAGRRVIEQTIGETLPEGFQTAEYIKDHGGIDLVISRKDLRDTIGTLITILLKKNKVTLAEATNENQEDPQKITWAAS